MKKYYPILLSKAGERTALKKLRKNVKLQIAPVIQILSDDIEKMAADIMEGWAFEGNSILFDFSLSKDIQSKIANIKDLFNFLSERAVKIIPVVQINSDKAYLEFVHEYMQKGNGVFCIRISNDTGGFTNSQEQINQLSQKLNLAPRRTLLLFDFGVINETNYNIVADIAISVISKIVSDTNYLDVIAAAGSFPMDLGTVIPSGQAHLLQRYEWDFYKKIQSASQLKKIVKYSDYGTKHPTYVPLNRSGTCSIKYTLKDYFAIYKGELSNNHRLGHNQYIEHAQKLVRSNQFLGKDFSWGDAKIDIVAAKDIVKGEKPGNATSWVEYSQNHHITLIESLL